MPRVSRRAAQGVPPYVHAGEGGNKLHIPMAVPQYMPVPHYARQTGQRVMSAPVSRTARAATGSGPVGTATGTAASLACPGVLPSPVPPRIESERHLSYSTPSTTSRIRQRPASDDGKGAPLLWGKGKRGEGADIFMIFPQYRMKTADHTGGE